MSTPWPWSGLRSITDLRPVKASLNRSFEPWKQQCWPEFFYSLSSMKSYILMGTMYNDTKYYQIQPVWPSTTTIVTFSSLAPMCTDMPVKWQVSWLGLLSCIMYLLTILCAVGWMKLSLQKPVQPPPQASKTRMPTPPTSLMTALSHDNNNPYHPGHQCRQCPPPMSPTSTTTMTSTSHHINDNDVCHVMPQWWRGWWVHNHDDDDGHHHLCVVDDNSHITTLSVKNAEQVSMVGR